MSANQPPPSPQPTPPSGGGRGPLIAIVGVVAVVGIVVGVMEVRSRAGKPTPPSTPSTPETPTANAPGVFDTDQPPPVYSPFDDTPVTDTPELFWLDVSDPKGVHATVRKNAWLGKALKDPLGQGFLAAWGGFFGTRGEDLGDVFRGAVADLVLDQVLSSPYRVAWYGGEGTRGAPAIVMPNPGTVAVEAVATLVKVAAAGGFNPPACVADGVGGIDRSLHRVVLADKTLYVARLSDRIVLAPQPQPALLAMCKPLPTPAKQGVAAALGFSLADGGRGTQSLAAVLGVDGVASLNFKIEQDAFTPVALEASADEGGRLAAAEPSADLLKAIPANSGVVLFLAMKLPKELTAISLRDLLAAPEENFAGTRKKWPLEPRQVAVVWNPRGSGATEIAVLWANTADEKGLTDALSKGNGALTAGKACAVLAFASTKELLADLQSACAGKRPSILQGAPAIAKGLSQSSSVSLTVNLGQVLSQLTIDGWRSEHPSANAKAGPQEIEAARKLLEELPSVGFRATVAADGSITSGGFRS